MKKQKPVKESAKVKVDIKALRKLLKKIDLKSSVISVIGLVVLAGVLSSTYNYITINPGGAQIPNNVTRISPDDTVLNPPCPARCEFNPGEQPMCLRGLQVNPAIYENIIVWEDGRDGFSDWTLDSIYVRNLADPNFPKAGKKLTTNKKGEARPDIYKYKVVWEDYRNGQLNADIYMYDLADPQQQEVIIADAPKWQFNPAIWGNYIVWEDERNDDGSHPHNMMTDIYAYDIKNHKELQITNTPDLAETMPDIWNDVITYNIEDTEGKQLDQIGVYYILSQSQMTYHLMLNNSIYHTPPTIDSNKIVWVEKSPSWPYQYEIKLATVFLVDGEMKITGVDLPQNHKLKQKDSAYVQGHNIVWVHDGPYLNDDIYLYDLITSIETQITHNELRQHQGTIYGNTIVWLDHRNDIRLLWPLECANNIGDIYIRTI